MSVEEEPDQDENGNGNAQQPQQSITHENSPSFEVKTVRSPQHLPRQWHI